MWFKLLLQEASVFAWGSSWCVHVSLPHVYCYQYLPPILDIGGEPLFGHWLLMLWWQHWGGVLQPSDRAKPSHHSVVWHSVRQPWMSAYLDGVWQVQTRPGRGGIRWALVRTRDAPAPDREHSSLSHDNTDEFLWVWQPYLTLCWSSAGKCSDCHSLSWAATNSTEAAEEIDC